VRLLVTGGAGFIGANYVHHRLGEKSADRLVVLDALTYAGNRHSLASAAPDDRFRFVHGDVRDQDLVEQLLREEDLDVIVHFAAESHVDRSIHGPDVFIETNVTGTHTLLKAARRVWLDDGTGRPHRFHHISTDEVYGSLSLDDPAFTEATPYAPNSPYSASKAASDHLVRAYHHTYGLETTITNCSNNYGPFQFPEKLIPLMLINALQGCGLPVYGDGGNVRDWLYVEDHLRGIDRVLENGRPGRTYNIGGRDERRNIEVVKVLCRAVDEAFARRPELRERFPESPAARGEACECLIGFVKDRPGHDRRYSVDCTRIETELGFRPVETFETGLRKTIDWYLDNEDWWRSVMDGRYRDWIGRHYGA
jgi:dTDP-glucose 4,6-dehydratase